MGKRSALFLTSSALFLIGSYHCYAVIMEPHAYGFPKSTDEAPGDLSSLLLLQPGDSLDFHALGKAPQQGPTEADRIAHRYGITGKNTNILTLESGEANFLKGTSVLSKQNLIPAGWNWLADHGVKVASVLKQMAPDAQVNLLDPYFLSFKQQMRLLSTLDAHKFWLVNWSGAYGFLFTSHFNDLFSNLESRARWVRDLRMTLGRLDSHTQKEEVLKERGIAEWSPHLKEWAMNMPQETEKAHPQLQTALTKDIHNLVANHKKLTEILPQNHLLIHAMGNNRADLESFLPREFGITTHHLFTDKSFLEKTILVAAMEKNGDLKHYSNRPEQRQKTNNSSWNYLSDKDLAALQKATITAPTDTSSLRGNFYSRTFTSDTLGGTSGAAPLVTGVASLLHEAFPNLSHDQVRSAILNAATRNIFIGHDTLMYDPNTTRVKKGELETSKSESSAFYEIQEGSASYRKIIPFDPSQYGQGILNTETSFFYASMLDIIRNETHNTAWIKQYWPTQAETFIDKVKKDKEELIEKTDEEKRYYLEHLLNQPYHPSVSLFVQIII